ncbi:hypothetical protein K502DRAFT_367130 [Neoconidiobolus thromboides FSU 785]|nr:hypothetical protein K502DRAFT_367130 [Neoconidiobolus thromboides FSU 785]
MTTSTHFKQSIKGHRCDLCFKYHYKCDRNLPTCNQCIKRNVPCTYNRTVIYNKTKINKKNQDNLKNKINVFSFVYINENKFQSKNEELKLFKILKDSNMNYNIQIIFNQFPRKSIFENLYNFLQNPSLQYSNLGLNLLLLITQKLNLANQKNQKNNKLIQSCPEPKINSIGPILKQAINIYFIKVNKLLPLFNSNQFNFHSCNFYLKSTILLAGLLHMETTPIIKQLISYFESKLAIFISKILTIPPNLQLIQLILILIIAIPCFPWIGQQKEYLLFLCNRMAQAIGLNHHIKYKNNIENEERLNTYCILTFYYTIAYLNIGTYLMAPQYSIELNKMENYYKKKLIENSFDFNKQNELIQQFLHFKLIQYYFIMSNFFFNLKLINEKNKLKFNQSNNYDLEFNKLQYQLTKVYNTYKVLMLTLIKKINDPNIKLIINQYQNVFTYFYDYLQFLLITTKFHLSDEKQYYESNEYSPKKPFDTLTPFIIQQIFLKCHTLIDSSINAHLNLTLAINCPALASVIMFILRYGKRSDYKGNEKYIEKGIEFLKELTKFPATKAMSGFNLLLIQIVQEKLQKEW